MKRIQDAEESEAKDQKRITQVNEQFDIKISNLKKWTEQFGLIEDGICKVALNQEVVSDDWTLESVKN